MFLEILGGIDPLPCKLSLQSLRLLNYLCDVGSNVVFVIIGCDGVCCSQSHSLQCLDVWSTRDDDFDIWESDQGSDQYVHLTFASHFVTCCNIGFINTVQDEINLLFA